MKENLLYLVHRIPYPPNKGDKIRSFHLLEYLSKRYNVFLGTFIDDPEDWKYAQEVEKYCSECCILELEPKASRLKSLSGFFTGSALSLPYYRNRELETWVGKRIREKEIGKSVIFSSPMAQYVEKHGEMLRIMDFVDVDSDKWKQYADSCSFPSKPIYAREGMRLEQYERRIAAEFDASFFVSEQEADHFRKIAPESSQKIHAYLNGVNADYFSPERAYENPYPPGEAVLVFTGAMDYRPNIDAVLWFADEVFPKLPGTRFYIVGSNPVETVRALSGRPGIHVTGRVPDVRPYLAHARLAVAPLRIARGIQNKVLEALAMGKMVAASPQAMEGIPENAGCRVCSDAQDFVDSIGEMLDSQACAGTGREFVLRHFDWERNLERISSHLARAS